MNYLIRRQLISLLQTFTGNQSDTKKQKNILEKL